MLKKIILGFVITAVLSATASGAVYAYQKEKVRTDDVVTGQNQSLDYGSGPGQDCGECENGENVDCLKEEERIRNNLRYRENNDQECREQGGEEHRWQYRYEYENRELQEGHEDCFKQVQNAEQNGNNCNGNNNGRGAR